MCTLFWVLFLRSEAELHFSLNFARYLRGQFFFVLFVFVFHFRALAGVLKMSVLFSTEELSAMNHAPVPIADLGLVSLGHEFEVAEFDGECDLADLECPPLLLSDLPLNSKLESMKDPSQL